MLGNGKREPTHNRIKTVSVEHAAKTARGTNITAERASGRAGESGACGVLGQWQPRRTLWGGNEGHLEMDRKTKDDEGPCCDGAWCGTAVSTNPILPNASAQLT